MRPHWRHGLIALGVTLVLALTLQLLFRLPWAGVSLLAVWIVAVNIVAFGYYGYDKGQAGASAPRIPDVVLHALAVGGGTFGAYAGMQVFRHKTIKGPFQIVFWFVAVLQILLIAALAYRAVRG